MGFGMRAQKFRISRASATSSVRRSLPWGALPALAVLALGACGRSDLGPAPSATPPLDCSGIDTQTDNDNCGACGNVCSALAPSTATCALGRCLVTLASGDDYAGIAGGATAVYWTTYGGGTVMKVPIGGGSPTTFAAGQDTPDGVAIDKTNLYWTSYDLDATVMKAPIGGGTPTALATGQVFPENVAVRGTFVYWATWESYGNNGKVMKIPVGGGTPTTLASGQKHPESITTDATSVYWGTDDAVMKVPIGGGTPTTFVSAQNVYGRVAVDATSVYYCTSTGDTNAGVVIKAPVGGSPTVLASGDPAYIALDGDSVYWTDVDPSGGSNGTVMKVPIGGGPTTILASGQDGPDRIAVDETSVYWTTYNDHSTGGGMSLMKLTPK